MYLYLKKKLRYHVGGSFRAGYTQGYNDLGICHPSFANRCGFVPRVGHVSGKHHANRIRREETVALSRFRNFP